MQCRTSRKEQGLRALADHRGIIAALAIDQRSALRKLFASAMQVEPERVGPEKLIRFKEAVSRVLTPHASSILLDPEYGLTAATERAKTAGLLLAYEQTGYEDVERMPRLLPGWSAEKLAACGTNGIKLLLYYSSESRSDVNARKQEFVQGVGEECAAAGVPFFLELVTYADGIADQSEKLAKRKPKLVTESTIEFSRARYAADVLKVGMPVDLTRVEGSPSMRGDALYRREQAIQHIRAASEAAEIPYVYLSEGVSNETFRFGLELALEAGVKFSGVLCGRATWKDGVAVFVENGERALEDWLGQHGVANIQAVNRYLHAATPWFSFTKAGRPGA